MVHHDDDDDNVIMMMITQHHKMMIRLDDGINHGMNDDKTWNHGMTWHDDGKNCGKNGVFRGEK